MRRAPTISISILCAASLLSGTSAQQKTPAKTAIPQKSKVAQAVDSGNLRRDTAFLIFTEAYDTARELPSTQRLGLVSEICDAAGALTWPRRRLNHGGSVVRKDQRGQPDISLTKKQREELKGWVEDLYSMGDEFPQDSREHMQAQFAATRAMVAVDSKRALEMLDTADVFNNRDNEFNMRDVVSMTLFQFLYRKEGLKAIPVLRRKALQFGEQDDYPFHSVASLLRELKGQQEIVRQFFNDAITAYRRTSQPLRKTSGMVSLISNRQIRNQLAPWQVQDAAEELAGQMRRAVQHPPEPSSGMPGLGIQVRTVKSALKQFSPELAATIPEPQQSVGGERTMPIASVQNQPVAEDTSIKELRKNFEDSRTAVMVLNEDNVHEGQQMSQTIDKAIDLGTDLVGRLKLDGKGESAIQDSVGGLRDTVQVGTQVNPSATLTAVRRIQDSAVRAEMLLTVAATIREMR